MGYLIDIPSSPPSSSPPRYFTRCLLEFTVLVSTHIHIEDARCLKHAASRVVQRRNLPLKVIFVATVLVIILAKHLHLI